MPPKKKRSDLNNNEYYSDKVRRMISEKGWFNYGTEDSYRKLLRACDSPAFDEKSIACMIWVNSDADFDTILREIRML